MPRYVTKVSTKNAIVGRVHHFTATRPPGAGEPSGWAVQCREHLTEPYSTESGAHGRLGVTERVGLCPLEHRVVPVWVTYPGRAGGPAKPADVERALVVVDRRPAYVACDQDPELIPELEIIPIGVVLAEAAKLTADLAATG